MPSRLKPLRIEEIIDGAALRVELTALAQGAGAGARAGVLALLGGALARGRAEARRRLGDGEGGVETARLLSRVTDEVLGALYDFVTTHVVRARNPTVGERFAVVAIGGYGRGELAPSSDLDLLFLRAYKSTPFSESATEYILYALWDLGLKVGHSSRSLNESLGFAKANHSFQTALLDQRLLVGDARLARELAVRFRREVTAPSHAAFIAEKLAERDARHQRAGGSRFMVEPNIKEGKGGLRDLHTLFWLAKHRYGFERLSDYVSADVFTANELRRCRRALDFLWKVRCHLHFLAGRAEERLTFDVQPEIARFMRYQARDGQSAVERFMRHYFLVAREVGALTRVLCAKLEADQAKRAPLGLKRLFPEPQRKIALVDREFRVEGGRLALASAKTLDDPANLLRLFQVADANDLDIHPAALGETARRAKDIDAAVRHDASARAAFLDVAASPHQPAAALRLMNEAGVLGRFVPEFGRIVARMQFNMYHHFTVDEHTLRAIGVISEIEKGAHAARHPLATRIFPKIINRRALYLAMLLHDTGKGEGDQQVEGEKAARAACERLGLDNEETDLVGWLVRHHLLMSDVAQKRDIADPRTIAQFAESVGSLERLRLLLVLTVADIRAVGPEVWNDWKGQLLRDLYRLTEAILRGGRSDEQGVRLRLSSVAAETRAAVCDELGVEAPTDWRDGLEDGYWLSHDGEALRWHAREMLLAGAAPPSPHVAARVLDAKGVTEILLYCPDRPGLFASLAAAISASGGDIAGARVHTTRAGAAFDIFSVQTSGGEPFGRDRPRNLAALQKRMAAAAMTDHAPPPPAPISRRNAAFAVEPWVRFDNEAARKATIIEASGRDRQGLLADLARVIADAGLSISSAHIQSQGARASDVFYVQYEGGPLEDEAKRDMLRAKLVQTLSAAAPAQPGAQPLAMARASAAG